MKLGQETLTQLYRIHDFMNSLMMGCQCYNNMKQKTKVVSILVNESRLMLYH